MEGVEYRRSSETKLVNRMRNMYGLLCKVYFGDWSSKNHQKGCTPAPMVGMRKLLSKWFKAANVDEFRTSTSALVN